MKSLYLLLLIISVVSFWSNPSFTQSIYSIPPQFDLEYVDLNTTGDPGLMMDMDMDDEGYLWITGTNGVLVFDGHQSILYNARQKQHYLEVSSYNSATYRLEKDTLGHLYTDHNSQTGIICINTKKRVGEKLYNVHHPAPGERTYYIATPAGDVYCVNSSATRDSFHLWKLNPDTPPIKSFSFSKPAFGNLVSYEITAKVAWLETKRGVWKIPLHGDTPIFHPFSGNTSRHWSLQVHENQVYFFDANSNDILRWTEEADQPVVITTLPTAVALKSNAFCVDRLIYFVSGANAFAFDPYHNTWQDLSPEFSNYKQTYYPVSIGEDIHTMKVFHGQLYILSGKHLFRLIPRMPDVAMFRESISVPAQPVTSMRGLAEDDAGNIYASYYSAITVKRKNSHAFVPLVTSPPIIADSMSAYTLSINHNHLIAHNRMIDLGNSRVETICPNNLNSHITHMRNGNTLWLYRWYDDQFYTYDLLTRRSDTVPLRNYKDHGGTFAHIINDMIADADKAYFWIATTSYGISKLNHAGQRILDYTHAALGASPDGAINDLWLDDNMLWYGCQNGLGVLNTRTGESTLYKNPVIAKNGQRRERTIYSILPDEHNGFYLGTDAGIVYFDKTQGRFYNLPHGHPLSQLEFNRTSALKASDGRYYMGTTNGLYSFTAGDLRFYNAADSLPPIKCSGIAIFNGASKTYRYISSAIDSIDQLTLHASDLNIAFTFSVPSFMAEVYYSYRIRGLDETWHEYSTDQAVLIHALPPGSYTLEIKASTNASDDRAVRYAMQIMIPQIWYRKAWVQLLAFITLGYLVFFVIRSRYQQRWNRQKALEELRTKISADLHDDVGSILSGVAMQSQVMSYEVPPAHKKSMLELSEMSREAMDRMRDTVWAIDSRKDKYENLIDRMRDVAEKNLERKNITHTFSVSNIDGKQFISPEVRQNLFLIFKEAITNVVRHSNASHVEITFSRDKNQLQLEIGDNGKNTSPMIRDGQGLSNMRLRADKINGKLTIGGENGFRVHVELSL